MIIEIKGQKIQYDISGEGKNVLLLHGWGCTKETMQCITNRLNKKMRVIALDFPGFGGSPEPPEHFGVGEYMEITAEFIRQLNIEGTDIICHSFGGRVSIMLAAKYPELVGKIVFTDAAGVRKKRTLKYYFKVYKHKLLKKLAKTKFFTWLFKLFGKDIQAKIKNAGSADYKALNDNMKKVFIRVVNEDLTHYLKDISSPSLLIWGENDKDTTVEQAKVMEKHIKDSGLVVLPNAGHYSFLDSYASYMVIVENFLGVN